MRRRHFLRRTAFFTVAAAVNGAPLAALALPVLDPRPDPARRVFPQGVASGDPKTDSIVFWTRCVRADGRDEPVPVTLQLALDADFARPVAVVPLVAGSQFDHTVRAKVKGLRAGQEYHYRFVAGPDQSPVGRTKTAAEPGSTLTQVRFGWINCQDWSVNHWGAMSLLAQEDLDFLVHVGDYIYETVPPFTAGAAEPSHAAIQFPDGGQLQDGTRYAVTLADYRALYRTYRSDTRLQAIHAKFPLIATWDDHEFSDDSWQDHQTYTNANPSQTERRRSANRAWVEYMPVDFGDVSFDSANAAYDNLRIYRSFRFGSLVHLVMTDERLYRDDHVVPEAVIAAAQGHDPVNGSDFIGSRYFVQRPLLQQFEAIKTAALGRPPSILGLEQTNWFKNTLTNSNAVWKLWGNAVILNRLWLDMRNQAPPPYNVLYVVDCDAWDGYPTSKANLLGFIKQEGIQNVVAITGDIHAFQCGVVRDDPDPAVGQPVMVDFVGAGVSSTSFYRYVKAGAAGTPLAALTATPGLFDYVLRLNNPDLAYTDHNAQGFATAVATPTSMTVTFHKVLPLNADGTAPISPLAKRTRFTLLAGTTQPILEDNV